MLNCLFYNLAMVFPLEQGNFYVQEHTAIHNTDLRCSRQRSLLFHGYTAKQTCCVFKTKAWVKSCDNSICYCLKQFRVIRHLIMNKFLVTMPLNSFYCGQNFQDPHISMAHTHILGILMGALSPSSQMAGLMIYSLSILGMSFTGISIR